MIEIISTFATAIVELLQTGITALAGAIAGSITG